ncbi:MAG TPA: exo-alpha-sialidase, partial [Gemmatimonadota bacterium]|nr:exo-alpha-sialidase [Gemmatimonadota bacterium]
MSDRTVVWAGTVKGLYGFESDGDRRDWTVTGPLLPEWEVSAILTDPDDPDHLMVGTSHFVWGTTLRETRDSGETWTEILLRDPEEPAEHPLKRVWQIVRGPEPGMLYAGVEDAALYRSDDDGATWRELTGLTSHPSRPNWNPGAGGLCLHTILIDPADPARMWVGISAVGVFATADGGETWTAMNRGLPPMGSTGSSDEDAMFCIHKIVQDPDAPGRLFMQFHAHTMTPDQTRSSGVFRKESGTDEWTAIDGEIPLKFGFPIAMSGKGELFVMPLLGDDNRVFDGGVPRVWRSTDRGESWDALDARPTDEPVFSAVLRDAMTLDGRDPTGIYAGTTGGDVLASADAGES